MLVLSRQRDETIMIGDDIEITVVDIRGDKVRLGITAPTRIAVHRKEVYDAISRENEQASRIAGGAIEEITQKIRPGPARNASRANAERLTAGRPAEDAPTPRVANGAKAQNSTNGRTEGMRGAG